MIRNLEWRRMCAKGRVVAGACEAGSSEGEACEYLRGYNPCASNLNSKLEFAGQSRCT